MSAVIVTGGTCALVISGQQAIGPVASITTDLAPRSTTVFENEQQVRLRPDDNTADTFESAGVEGLQSKNHIGPNSTELEETVTRNRKAGFLSNALPAVSDEDSGGSGQTQTGETLGNKFFTLRGGATPNVPETYALIFIDTDNSILGNAADGKITIDYEDDTDTNRVEAFQLTIDGLGPHFTANKVKAVNHVEGTLFDTSGPGQPAAADTLIFGPACEDDVHSIVGTSGTRTTVPQPDPQTGANDGDASYVSADSTSDQRVYCGLNSVTYLNLLHIASVKFDFFFKSLSGSGAGVEAIIRDGVGADHTIISAFNGTAYTVQSVTLTINPITTNDWTVTDLNNLQVGCRFKGENPTIEKRWAFMRCIVTGGVGFVHPSIDGTDPANIADMWQTVNKDPFAAVTDDATQYIQVHSRSFTQNVRFTYGDLEADAISVNSVDTRVRATVRNISEKNGSGENDMPCGNGAAPRSNNVQTNRLDGPREQTNLGGLFITHDLKADMLSARTAHGIGDPDSVCGTFGGYDGQDAGYGNYVEYELDSVVNSSSDPITVAEVNDMKAGFLMKEDGPEYRMSRLFSTVEYLRQPTGSVFFHIVVDDDPAAPDDADYMASKHSANKEMGVDFAGIQETSAVNSITIIIRARTDASATLGWRVILRLVGQADIVQATETNTSFATKEYQLLTNPNTSAKFTRTEVNGAQLIFESFGETPYFAKDVSLMRLRVNYTPIPSKIDNARRIQSERLSMLSRPVGLLRWTAPMAMANAELMRDVAATHRAIPRTFPGLGAEQWERMLGRVFTKSYDLNEDRIHFDLFDMRNYIVTFLFTGQTTKKGRSFDGMMVITNGVTVQFARPTNAYTEDPFAGLLQELNTDEPETSIEGVRVENTRTNLLLNAGLGEGAADVFTDWASFGLPATGASIVDDVEVFGWDKNFAGAPQRSAKFTGADSVADIGFSQVVDVPTGDGLSPEGARFVAQIYHQDDSGSPLSVGFAIKPNGFSEEKFRVENQRWAFSASQLWWDLPVASTPTVHRVPGHFPNMDFIPSSPVSATRPFEFKIASRTAVNQVNHVYGAQLEGGTFEDGEDATYPSSLILTRNGPVLRQIGSLWVPNRAANPTYYFERNTFFCVAVSNWDSPDMPWQGGALRYIFSNVLDASNHDRLYYDQATESFIFERKVANVTSQSTRYYPAVAAGREIRLATRCVSSLGDHGLAANSIQLFVDDIAGSLVTPAGIPTMPTESEFYIGSEEGLNGTAFDGTLKRIRVTQQTLLQEQIAKLR